MCKLVVTGVALFLAGLYWSTWVDLCKHEDLVQSLLITSAVCIGYGAALLTAELGDMGLSILREKISAHLALRREALRYLMECKKREEVPNDWPSNL